MHRNIRPGGGQMWRYEISIYPSWANVQTDLTGVTLPSEVKRLALEVADTIDAFLVEQQKDQKGLSVGFIIQGQNIADRLRRLSKSDLCDEGYFNNDLDRFYDWADQARILVK